MAALAQAVVLLDEEEGARGVWTRRGQEVWEMGRLRERMRWEFSREGEHGDWWRRQGEMRRARKWSSYMWSLCSGANNWRIIEWKRGRREEEKRRQRDAKSMLRVQLLWLNDRPALQWPAQTIARRIAVLHAMV